MPYTIEDTKRLADYIKKQIKSGYDITTIRNFLISNGYTSSLVDASIDSVYGNSESKQAGKLAPQISANKYYKPILISILGLVIILGLIFGFIKIFGEEAVVDTQNIPTERTPLGSQNNLKNNEIANQNTNQNNAENQEIPSQNQQNNENIVETARVNEDLQTYEPTILEIDNLINTKSEAESQKLCVELKDEYKKNSCYKKLAIKSDKPEYCDNIDKINLKDNCYFIFAFAGKSQFCEKIQDTYQRLTCNSYGKAIQEESL